MRSSAFLARLALAMAMGMAMVISGVVACSQNTKREDGPPVPAHDDVPTTQRPTVAGPKVVMTTAAGEVSVDVEVVATDATIMRGLMYRDYLPPENGMLFLMGKEYPWQFYMRNTLIPLDMIFIKADMTIAGIVENAEPKTETLREVGVPSSFVLEVNGGYSAKHKLAAGQKVRFDKVDQKPPSR